MLGTHTAVSTLTTAEYSSHFLVGLICRAAARMRAGEPSPPPLHCLAAPRTPAHSGALGALPEPGQQPPVSCQGTRCLALSAANNRRYTVSWLCLQCFLASTQTGRRECSIRSQWPCVCHGPRTGSLAGPFSYLLLSGLPQLARYCRPCRQRGLLNEQVLDRRTI